MLSAGVCKRRPWDEQAVNRRIEIPVRDPARSFDGCAGIRPIVGPGTDDIRFGAMSPCLGAVYRSCNEFPFTRRDRSSARPAAPLDHENPPPENSIPDNTQQDGKK